MYVCQAMVAVASDERLLRNLSQTERTQRSSACSRRRIPSWFRNLRSVFRFRGDGAQRPGPAGQAGSGGTDARRGARPPAGPFGGRLRPAPAPRAGTQAGDRPGRGRDRRRGPGGRPRLEHDGLLPGPRAARQARARGRHERAADRRRAGRRAGRERAGHRRAAAALRDVAGRRPGGRDCCARPASTSASWAREGSSLERGLMDLNPEEVRIKQEMADACERVVGIFDSTKWHRSALLSFVADPGGRGRSSPTRGPERGRRRLARARRRRHLRRRRRVRAASSATVRDLRRRAPGQEGAA